MDESRGEGEEEGGGGDPRIIEAHLGSIRKFQAPIERGDFVIRQVHKFLAMVLFC